MVENASLKEQNSVLKSALKPFANVFNQFPASKIKQQSEVFAYNDAKLMVSDFEKANELTK
jgi:hypothetical protein